jgi:hypothetical protein
MSRLNSYDYNKEWHHQVKNYLQVEHKLLSSFSPLCFQWYPALCLTMSEIMWEYITTNMQRNQVIRRKGRLRGTEYITVPYRTLKFQQKIITTTTVLGHTVLNFIVVHNYEWWPFKDTLISDTVKYPQFCRDASPRKAFLVLNVFQQCTTLEEQGSRDTHTALYYIHIDTTWSENLCFFHNILQTKFSKKLADMNRA